MRARFLRSLTACWSTEMSKRNFGWISHSVNPADISLAPPWGWREQLWPTCCSDYGNNLTASQCRRRLETMTCVLVWGKCCCSCWRSGWRPQPKTTCVGALVARPGFKTRLDSTSVLSIKIILLLVLNLREVNGGLKVCESRNEQASPADESVKLCPGGARWNGAHSSELSAWMHHPSAPAIIMGRR